jgi:hypothetical protein
MTRRTKRSTYEEMVTVVGAHPWSVGLQTAGDGGQILSQCDKSGTRRIRNGTIVSCGDEPTLSVLAIRGDPIYRK